MSTLTSQSVNLQILPVRSNFEEGRKWVEIFFSLEVKVLGKTLLIEPTRHLMILYENLSQLCDGTRRFVERVQNVPEGADPIKTVIEPFKFVPLTLDFEFACLNGDVSGDASEGEVTLQIMANLEIIDEALSSEYVGCITNIEIKNLMNFLATLEMELSQL